MTFRLIWKEENTSEDGHQVYRQTTPIKDYLVPTPIGVVGPDIVEYFDELVEVPSQDYYYRVDAYITGGIPLTGLPTDFVAQWTMDDVVGSLLNETNDAHDGTLIGTPTFVAGRRGNAISLNGTDQYVTIVDHANLRPTSVTVIGRIKTSDVTAVARCIFAAYSSDTNKGGYRLNLSTVGGLTWTVASNTGNVLSTDYEVAQDTTDLRDGIYHDIAATYDGSDLEIFIDGESILTVPYAGGLAYEATTYIRIGQLESDGASPTWFFAGDLDDMEVFGRILSLSEIRAFSAQVNPIDTGLLSNEIILSDDTTISPLERDNDGFFADFEASTGSPKEWIDKLGQNNLIDNSGVMAITDLGNAKAISFDGVADYLAIKGIVYAAESTHATVSGGMWFRTPDPGRQQCLMSFDKSEFFRFELSTDQAYVGVGKLTSGFSLQAEGIPNRSGRGNVHKDQWHLGIFTFDNGVYRIYLDGVLDLEIDFSAYTTVFGPGTGGGVVEDRWGCLGVGSEMITENDLVNLGPLNYFVGDMAKPFYMTRVVTGEEAAVMFGLGVNS